MGATTKKISLIAAIFFYSISIYAQCEFEEKDGLVIIEAEDMDLPSDWHIKTDKAGYTGESYITWEGGDNFNNPGEGIITTLIKISKTGTYSFVWRNAVGEGTDTTEFNDSWLRFPDASDFYGQKGNDVNARVYPKGSGKMPEPEGSGSDGWFKIYTGGTTDWNWNARTSDNDAHNIYVEFDTPGTYTMEISGRSDKHAIDRISLSNEGENATDVNTAKTTCGDVDQTTCSSITLSAINDFENINVSGFSPAYIDNTRGALAIDATLYKDTFAAASTNFTGASGAYNLTLNTLTELDGESSYIIKVNGVQVGTTFQNPTTSTDYAPAFITFNNINIENGDDIQVEFNSHTNGLIPEGDSTAYSRGRWTSLVFTCVGDVIEGDVVLSGELKRWHKITLDFEGPNTSETASTNPFSDYRLDVTFSNGNKTYVVPGYYSGCSNPDDTSCASGNIWKVNFAPDRTGTWNWSASFKTGSDIAINGGGSSTSFDGTSGSFVISESDKSGRDFRSADLGRLQYVGEHYLKHSGTNPDNPNGPWFVKAGADSPENTFAYEDFDNTPNRGSRRKAWEPHQQDYVASDASEYTWDSGKGSELLGVVNYLSSEGANAMSFLTFSLGGDDENIFPHLLKVSESVYNGYNEAEQWSDGVHKDRFDVSKLAQWEKIFEYADKKGMYLHFKTMETENDNFMDNNENGRERKLYYRELIARFGHHLALNWNITEETTLDSDVVIDVSEYIKQVDPYDHNIVIHTYPNQKDQEYTPLLGNNSALTGASLQSNSDNVHNDVITWINNSANAGKKWVVANDEQGPASTGVRIDDEDIREKVLYGTFMAGGAGVEYYYGYTPTDGDLNNQDHRLRGVAYEQAGYALDFFNTYLQDHLIEMESNDGITSDNDDYVFAKEGEVYAVYRPNGGTTNISLPTGDWTVQWYNPRIGGNLTPAEPITASLVAPNTNDWVALITGEGVDTGCENTAAFIEAECYDDMYEIQTEQSTENNLNVGYINDGDWALYENIDLTGMQSIEARVACNFDGGDIEIHLGSPSGELIGRLPVVNTGGNQEWVTISGNIEETNGVQDLYLVFTGEGTGFLFNINYFSFSTEAVLSIDDVKTVLSNVSIYPNPVVSSATIKNAEGSTITIYDMNGKMVLSKDILNDSETINMNVLPTGTYYTEVVSSASTSMVKLIKE